MNYIQSIKEAIRLTNPQSDNYSVVCNVSDIDLAKSICNCTPINGSAVLVNVRINADNKKGLRIIPTDGSIVVVTLINNTTGYVSMVSEIDEIQLNGDTYNGLIKIDNQTAKLNQLVTQLQAQLALIAAGIATGGGSYTPGTLSTFSKSDYENTTIKHGNGS